VGYVVDLSGQVALVTGAGSGIGKATARLLASAGATVAIADLDAEAAEGVSDEINDSGNSAIALHLDITDAAATTKAVQRLEAAEAAPTIVVNNAASWALGPFLEIDQEAIDRTFGVTVFGSMNVTRATLPGMVERRAGRIIFIISDAARIGEAAMSVYAAAKGALTSLTKSLAREVGSHGITVNGVSPGTTKTPPTVAFLEQTGNEQRLLRSYPLGRLGEPSDIAHGVLFFASPMSDWVTGQILSVSGGFSM
jgi:NAD(P)-dependent dehydrogenase (short-subunit alcohol dehydrogenase family)